MLLLNKKTLTYIFIFTAAAVLGITLRLYTLFNNIPHEIDEKAASVVIKQMRRDISRQIERSHPALSPVEKQRIAREQFNQILHRDRDKVRQTIDRVSKELLTDTPPKENPYYLAEADSYYYLNLTENILKTGKMSPQIRGSKYLNPLMNAPQGYWEPLNLHPYIGAFVCKIVNFFKPAAPLMEALSFTPLLLTVLILAVFLFCCAVLDCHPGITFLASVYLLCAPVFLRRSMFGWYKNDPENIFFLLLIPTVLFYGLKNIASKKTALKTGLGVGILLALYSLFWQGWVFMASLIALSGFMILIYQAFLPKSFKYPGHITILFSCLILCAFIGVSVIFGVKDFFVLFQEGWKALQDFINPRLSAWPDLYIAVSELLSPSPGQWLTMLGGVFFVGVGALGLAWRIVQIFVTPLNKNNSAVIFLAIFYLISLKLSFSAQRFETLCLIPFSLAFALGCQTLFEYAKKYLFKFFPGLKQSPFTGGFIFICVLFLLAAPAVGAARKITPDILNKIYNSTWDAALKKIEKDTPEESIINSWWPPGHFIKAMAHRRVTFDGATISLPQSYWLANAFLATDEKTSAGIFRMLNNSGNAATDYLVNEGFTLSQATRMIKGIAGLDENQARDYLADRLKKDQVQHLLSLTHAKAPPSYVLIYNEMAEESLQFSFVAKWNFSAVDRINHDPDLLKSVPKRGSKDYIPYLWRIAGGPPRYTPILSPILIKGPAIFFENNILVDRSSLFCKIDSEKYGKGIPRSLLYEENGEFHEKIFSNATLPVSIVLINDRTGPLCMLADTALARSVLFRLYFFGGKGLKAFQPFADERDATQRTKILTYKVDWNKI